MDRQYTPEEIQKRFRDLHRDRDLLESGWTPKEGDIADAPVIGNWIAVSRGGELALVGVVAGHPRLRGLRRIVTSPLVAIDIDAGWARTEGRFYRLGPQYDPPAYEPSSTLKF
jgi:hypothetical protein